jgi:hypothetical protein
MLEICMIMISADLKQHPVVYFFLMQPFKKTGCQVNYKSKAIIMKKTILSATVLAAIASLSSCCKMESENCDRVAAKIIRYDCDRVIFQLLTTENIGDTDWQDLQTGTRYKNVVYYNNTCAIASLTNGNKDTLYVSIKRTYENNYDSDCVQCKAISLSPPQTKIDFTEVSRTRCTPEPNGSN